VNETNKVFLDLNKTKAELLSDLLVAGYNVPPVYYFSVERWNKASNSILDEILCEFPGKHLAVRSSTFAEDTETSSMAGAFESILNVKTEGIDLRLAIEEVIKSYDEEPLNQVLIQPMVSDVAMSGVIMSRVLDDGSPYYVVNYDDKTGLTDTVTSGSTINKTVYVYKEVDLNDFDSPFLLETVLLIRKLENQFPNYPLDIEFAIDNSVKAHLLQVRRITTLKYWKPDISKEVSKMMLYLHQYLEQVMRPRHQILGSKTLLGFMPDWNPAEMIGVIPSPLSMSLYRKLITTSTWRIAREKMGYRKLPNIELMISLFGRVYIDVRNSINSFLPCGISDEIGEKIVNAYIERLDQYPQLHDKLEFEVVHTAYDFDFDTEFKSRYPQVLENDEFSFYRNQLIKITKDAILNNGQDGSINKAIDDINKLTLLQEKSGTISSDVDIYSLSDRINGLITDCIEFGTLPFSILARHAFIAEGLLRSAVNQRAISGERLDLFKRSMVSVAGEMSKDFTQVLNSKYSKEEYLLKYGHLRPSSYDILSPNYSNRKDLFKGAPRKSVESQPKFVLSKEELEGINDLLSKHQMIEVSAELLFHYAENAIKGREYAKFVFTKTLSEILESVAIWGSLEDFDREQVSMLSIDEILSVLFEPIRNRAKKYYQDTINTSQRNYKVATSFKLNYLIRSAKDVFIVPMQRSVPNFIGHLRIEAETVELKAYSEQSLDLENKIVCIEGADPGYDWIFTRNIAGLVTKYGGANSHMAIRSAEYGIPAAIGCGEQPFERIVNSKKCFLDCIGKRLDPLELN
jgi:glutamine kinase